MQRLKTRAQYEAAMAGGTVSRTPHFVLHRAPLAAPSDSPEAPEKPSGIAAGGARVPAAGSRGRAARPLFASCDEPWVGVVVPKRWAKRAVTRNGIRRQIYNVSAAFASRLPAAAHVVRLRMDFARAEFPSAWSEPLKAAVRGELQALFERAAQGVSPGGKPAKAVIPAQAVIPAKAGIQGQP